jgi:heat shock protein HtpX
MKHHAVVAVTEGLLRILNRDELEGVLAHELTHIKNKDMLIGSIAATLAGAIVMLANMAQWAAIFGGLGGRDSDEGEGGGIFGMILMAILAPIAATIIQMAISRSREYMADDGGARISGKPYGLAGALEKLFPRFTDCPHERKPLYGPYVYCQSPDWTIADEPVQHPSAN